MAILDNLFGKKPPAKSQVATDTGLTSHPPQDAQALERKAQRLERRELLYAVVRESMARVGVLSTSYKYKVLSLDARGNQYLIMMDLPREMAEHIGQLAEIESAIVQAARSRHQIDVTAVYWRIADLARAAVLRKPRVEPEREPAVLPRAETQVGTPTGVAPTVDRARRRFEPIRPDEVHAFRQALAQGRGPAAAGAQAAAWDRSGPASEFPATEFEPTRLDEDFDDRLPLSRTQYGDLI
jgi:hypothetical protein